MNEWEVAKTKTADDVRTRRARTSEERLVLFDALRRDTFAVQLLHVEGSINDAARSQEEGAQDEFFDGVGVGAWGVEHGDTLLGHELDLAVVGASSAAGNGASAQRHIFGSELVGTQDDGLAVFVVVADVVLVARKLPEANRRNLVECLDAQLGAGGHVAAQ